MLARYPAVVRRSRVTLALVIALPVVAVLTASCVWPRINDVSTGQTPEYPDILPQRIAADAPAVFAAALDAAKSSGLDVTSADETKGEINGVATTRLFRFKDDVTIRVSREGSETVVNIRSKSRVGKGDLGANARRIRALQAAIAARVAR